MKELRVIPGGSYALPELLRLHQTEDDPDLPRLVRHAVRGVIRNGDRYALVKSRRFGECKFPGGGMESGEDYSATLVRELGEETGLMVLPESIRPWGYAHELRKSREGGLFDHTSWYCFCSVGPLVGETVLDAYEHEYGYHVVWLTLHDAIANNEKVMAGDWKDTCPWTLRDTQVMGLLADADLFHHSGVDPKADTDPRAPRS